MISITLQNITKVYEAGGRDGALAVDDVDLRVEPGELFFLLGPSGCGKTTLLRMIAGLIEPTDGRIYFGDRDVTRLPVEKRNTALVFQSYALWPHMTVQRNVEFGPKMRGADAVERRSRAEESLARVEMGDFVARKPNQLSGGQQQRVAVARALAARPEVLLLDEPLSNLDARLRLHMRNELRQLVKATGTTGVYVTHDQKEALSMADRIAVMNAGKIVQVGTPETLYNEPATVFVADFLGEANFIEGRIDPSAPRAEVDTPAGALRARQAPATASGVVTCCVRPERIELRPRDTAPQKTEHAADGEPNRLPGTVELHTFLGEVRQYLVRLSGETVWRVTDLTGGAEPRKPGENVDVCFPAEAVAILDGPARA